MPPARRRASVDRSACRLGQLPLAVGVDPDPTLSGRRVDDRLLALGPLPAVARSLGLLEVIELLAAVDPLGSALRTGPVLCDVLRHVSRRP